MPSRVLPKAAPCCCPQMKPGCVNAHPIAAHRYATVVNMLHQTSSITHPSTSTRIASATAAAMQTTCVTAMLCTLCPEDGPFPRQR
jgi:hypothetical protein